MNLKQIEEEALHSSEKDETFAKFLSLSFRPTWESVCRVRRGTTSCSVIPAGIQEASRWPVSGHSREGGNPCVWKFDAAAFSGMTGRRGNDEAWK